MNKLYGLTQVGNKYFYAMQKQAFVVQLLPHPMAWRKTPSTSWQRAHGNFLRLDMLGFGILELDPLADFDRSSITVNRLIPSSGRFHYEPDWHDTIPFPSWQQDTNWKETVADLISWIHPKQLIKLRQFSHFHWRLIEALHDWPGFAHLLDINPALAVAVAGRVTGKSREQERPKRLDYKSLYLKSEQEIAAALGFGTSDDAVNILRKVAPDACNPHDLVRLAGFIRNSITRKALIAAEIINHCALLFLRHTYLLPHLTGRFITEIARLFPHMHDIVTCSWGPLLRGGGKGDQFTWKYQQALDVVQFAEDPTIHSVEDLERKHSAVFKVAYSSRCGNR